MIKLAYNKSNTNLVFEIDKIDRVAVGNAGIKEDYVGTLVDYSTDPETKTLGYRVQVTAFEMDWSEVPVDVASGGGGGSIGPLVDISCVENREYTVRPDTGYDGVAGVNINVDVATGEGVQGIYELIIAPESHLDNGDTYTIDDIDFTAVYVVPEAAVTPIAEPVIEGNNMTITAQLQSVTPATRNVRIDSFTASYTSGGEPVEVTVIPQYPAYSYQWPIVMTLPVFNITDKYPDDIGAITVTANVHCTTENEAQMNYMAEDIASRLGDKYTVTLYDPSEKTIRLTQKMGYYSNVAPTLVSTLGDNFYVSTITTGKAITAVRVEAKKEVVVTNNYSSYRFTPDNGYDVMANIDITTQIDLPLTSGIKFGYSTFNYLPQELAMNTRWNQVLNCNSMFYNCTHLQSVGNLATTACTDFKNMFYECSALQAVGNISMNSCQQFTNMFAGCVNLNNNSLDNILMSINNINVAGLIDTPKIAGFGFSDSQMTYIKNSPMLSTLEAKGWTLGNSVTLNVDLTEFRSKIDSGNNFDLPWSQDLADLMNLYTTRHIILEDTTLGESIDFVATYMGSRTFANETGTIIFDLGEEWNSQDEHYDYYCYNIISNQVTVSIDNKVFDETNTTFVYTIYNNSSVPIDIYSIAFNGETPIVLNKTIGNGNYESHEGSVVGDYSATDITYVIDNDLQ